MSNVCNFAMLVVTLLDISNVHSCFKKTSRKDSMSKEDQEKSNHLQELLDMRLFQAAKLGDLNVMESAIRDGANIEYRIKGYEYNPLTAAIMKNNQEAVQLLLKKGASPLNRDSEYRSPIYYAAQEGRDSILPMLIKAGKDVDAKEFERLIWNPLSAAVKKGHVSTVRLLLDQGACTAVKSSSQRSIIKMEAGIGNFQEILKMGAKIGNHQEILEMLNDCWKDYDDYDWNRK